MEVMPPTFTVQEHYNTNKMHLWINDLIRAAKKKSVIHVELRQETTIDQFVLCSHSGVMRAAPNLCGEFPLIVSYSNFEELDQCIEIFKSNPNWDNNIKFRILFGLPVVSIADNNHDIIKHIISKMLQSEHKDVYQIGFVQGWDMYNDSDSFCSKYRNTLSELKNEDCYFYVCNTAVLTEFERQLPGCMSIYYSIYPTRLKNLPVSVSHPTFFNEDSRYNNRARSRKVMCLNNANKQHRYDIVKMLNSYDPCDQYTTLRHNGKYLKHEQLLGELEGGITGHYFLNSHQDCPPLKYITDAYAYIATETYHDSQSVSGLLHQITDDTTLKADRFTEWWTEKTFKAIYYELPFMVVGVKDTLKGLKKLGFETFPELFDESYDSIDMWSSKKHIYEKNIDNLMSMTHSELHNLYYSDSIQKKLKHNKELYLQLIENDPFN